MPTIGERIGCRKERRVLLDAGKQTGHPFRLIIGQQTCEHDTRLRVSAVFPDNLLEK